MIHRANFEVVEDPVKVRGTEEIKVIRKDYKTSKNQKEKTDVRLSEHWVNISLKGCQ